MGGAAFTHHKVRLGILSKLGKISLENTSSLGYLM